MIRNFKQNDFNACKEVAHSGFQVKQAEKLRTQLATLETVGVRLHQQVQNKAIDDALEQLQANGFDGLCEAVQILMNTAMVTERKEYLGAVPYERGAFRAGHANGFEDKTVETRMGADGDGRCAHVRLRGCLGFRWALRARVFIFGLGSSSVASVTARGSGSAV